MPLRWSISHDPALVVVDAEGAVTRTDIENYLAAMIRQGVKGHKKLFNLMKGGLALSRDDLDLVAESLVRFGQGEPPGPVAIAVKGTLNLDMAVLLKQRVGSRPFRVFLTVESAMGWLTDFRQGDSQEETPPAVGKPHGGGWRSSSPRRNGSRPSA